MRYGLNINLKAIPNAFVCPIQGKTATKNCLCIPLDSEGVFVGDKTISISATAYENTNFGHSHTLRLSIDSSKYESMTEEQRKAIPFIGHMKEFVGEAGTPDTNAVAVPAEDVDLPF